MAQKHSSFLEVLYTFTFLSFTSSSSDATNTNTNYKKIRALNLSGVARKHFCPPMITTVKHINRVQAVALFKAFFSSSQL